MYLAKGGATFRRGGSNPLRRNFFQLFYVYTVEVESPLISSYVYF